MRIDSSGNVGIGTSSPTQKLTVNGNIAVNAGFLIPYNGVTPTGYIGYGTALGTANDISIRSDTGDILFGFSGSEKMRLNTSGNLGLGVTPSAWSAIKSIQVGTGASFSGGSGYNDAFIASNAYYDGTNWRYLNSNTAHYASIGGTASARWYTAASGTEGNAITFTQAMTLDASGNLGVGVTSPTAKLHLYESAAAAARIRVLANGGQHASLQLAGNGTSFGTTSFDVFQDGGSDAYIANRANASLQFWTNNTERMRIDSAGNVGIGVASPTVKLDVAGSILASGNVTAYSDIRVKDNVESITDAIGKLSQIRGVTYTRTDLDDKERKYAGVIAQEIEQVLPEAVFDNGKVKAVDYNATIALLIEAVKEQQCQINELKLTIEQLKGN
jgi:hypothetical protein